jgi:hypothetical protein
MNEQFRDQPGQYREVSRDELMAKQEALKTEQRRIDATVAKQAADPWVHRSSGMRCRTCIWFVSKEPQALTVTVKSHEVGRCRRHAPTMGGYPVVYMTDWCGDHRLDENKI